MFNGLIRQSDWSQLNLVDSDWLSSKVNKVLTLNNQITSRSGIAVIFKSLLHSFVQLDITLIYNTFRNIFASKKYKVS